MFSCGVIFVDTRCSRSEINFQLRSYTRNVKFLRISTKMGPFIVAIGIPCIMDVWEGHREPSQTEQCSELLAYEEICGHLLLLLYMAKLAAETILSTHFPLIWSHKLQNITFILVFFHPPRRLQHENFLTLTRKYNST